MVATVSFSDLKSSARRWGARIPLAPLALASVLGWFGADKTGNWWAGLILVLLGPLLWRWRGWRWGGSVLAGGLLWVGHGVRVEALEDCREWVEEQNTSSILVQGVVTELRDRDGFLPGALVRVDRSADNPEAARGSTLGVRRLRLNVQPGDRVLLRGEAALPEGARNPREFSVREWMDQQGVAAELWVERSERQEGTAWWMGLSRRAWVLRQEVRERVVLGLDEEGRASGVIRALVLGDRTGGGRLFEVFRQSGTMHVFAVSGLHVGLVATFAWFLLKWLRVPRRAGLWGVLLILWSYAFVTGLNPPALRAALMASFLLLGFTFRRQPCLANNLLASIPIVLLLDSFQLAQAGFQLSYTVVASILLFAPFFYRRIESWVEHDPFLPRVLLNDVQRRVGVAKRWFAGLLVVSVAAWMGSLPLIGVHFGMITPGAVLASLVLVPLVSVMLALALLGLMVGVLVPPLERAANVVNGGLAEVAYYSAHKFAELPGSHVKFVPGGWEDEILVFDLWDGDAAVYIAAGDGVLIDGGGEDQFEEVVVPALETRDFPASLVLSHADQGHAGGLAAALEQFEIRQLLLPVEKAGSPAFRALLENVPPETELGREGQRYPIAEDIFLEVLRMGTPERGSRADDRCMILRLHWHGWRILLTGDAGFATERELLDRGVDVKSDVWIMGRHSSDFTGSLEFVQAVEPQVIIAGEAFYPEEEQLPEWWAEAVAQLEIDLWRQRDTGAVALGGSNKRLKVRSYLDRSRVRTLRRD